MIRIQQLKLPVTHTEEELVEKIVRELKIKPQQIASWEIVRRSLDARHKGELKYVYLVDVETPLEQKILKRSRHNNIMSTRKRPYAFSPAGSVPLAHRPVVIGSGPAGLFCGYMLAKHGYQPLILERGDEAVKRKEKVDAFWAGGALDISSNVQFGEGGAGTFSDGKLNTTVKDPLGRNRKVLELFVEAGAPSSILYEQKPHLGTDILIGIVQTMRRQIIDMGGEVRFNSTVTDLCAEDGKLAALEINGSEWIPAEAAVTAIGHSARDTFRMLHRRGVHMEAKSFAVGVRIEHPQEMINRSQYGYPYPDLLGASSYKLTHQTREGRGVYSFCMCPGGYVVNASSEEGMLAVNGMSYQDRGSRNANSALIVTVNPSDFAAYHMEGTPEIFDGISFQRHLERLAYSAENGRIPVQLFKDFRAGKESAALGDIAPCCKGEYALSNVRALLPDFIGASLEEAICAFDRKIEGFARPDCLLSAVESRTSSPIRIRRDESFQSSLRGLYPCGEGAGYAGGITSAAIDGLKVAEALCSCYARPI